MAKHITGLNGVKRRIGGISGSVEKARRSALPRVATGVRAVALRALAAINRIPQKALRLRRRVSRVGALRANIFLGLRDIKPSAFGKPVQQGARTGARLSRLGGVRVSNRFYRSAFLAPSISRSSIFKRVGRGRLPIRKVKEPIIGGQQAARSAVAFARERLPIVLRRELKFRLRSTSAV